jgi:rare lipoprotein A (peptidoglycan hydrolase)
LALSSASTPTSLLAQPLPPPAHPASPSKAFVSSIGPAQPLSLNAGGVGDLLKQAEPAKRSTPAHALKAQVGKASWYGPGFHGRRTASGRVFDQNKLSAAHPTLQLLSLVRVTNLENGESVVVQITDRGPYKKKRIIDVSKQAAKQLGFLNQGIARVRVEVLREGRG